MRQVALSDTIVTAKLTTTGSKFYWVFAYMLGFALCSIFFMFIGGGIGNICKKIFRH